LIRDRVGVKPLYYTFQDGAVFFASEIKALLKHPSISKSLNRQALYDYLTFAASPPGETMFSGIHKLEAGHVAVINQHGEIRKEKYWDLTHETESFPKESFNVERFCVDNIRRLLRESIKLRMMSDVPFGVMLSGGVDSSLNVALMSELMTRPVETFTVGFKDLQIYNELDYARQISTQFQTTHHEILLTEKDAIDFLPKMVWHQDEPNADPVCVPLYFVSKLCRDSGTIVAQVGEGSDESFSGYRHYQRELKFYNYYHSLLPNSIKSMLYRLGRKIYPESLASDYLRRAAEDDSSFYGGAVNIHEELKQNLLTPYFLRSVKESGRISRGYFEEVDRQMTSWQSRDYLRKMIYTEFKNRLAELLLMRVDKMTMAASIEARVPFLDHRLVEFAFRIPSSLKIKNGVSKYILKKAAEGIIPNRIIYRRKQGFAAPASEWLRSGKLSGYSYDRIMESGLMKEHLFRKKAIQRLFDDHRGGKRNLANELWTLLIAALWHDAHFKN
jgi:asparagine synthase (glutamine-hydrolysing)